MAQTTTDLYAQVKGNVDAYNSATGFDQPLQANNRGDLLTAPSLPEIASLVSLGRSWHILSAATAALTAVPTTTAGHSLQNGEAVGSSVVYLIDSFGTVEIVTDATQQNSLALFAMVNKGATTAMTDAGLTRGSLNGRAYDGRAKTQAGATVVNDIWTPVGPSTPGATAFAGAVWRVTECRYPGLFQIPAGYQFNVACAKTVGTASQIQYFIRWHEVALTSRQ